MPIRTARTVLRPWSAADGDAFAAMHADPEVMADVSGPLTRSQSDAKLQRYMDGFDAHGFSRWAVEDHDGRFIGYAWVAPTPADIPLTPGFQIGWRFVRRAWGQGLASEASAAALADVFARTEISEVVSYTAPDNLRSQGVMRRLELERDASRDFVLDVDGAQWTGWVWVAERRTRRAGAENWAVSRQAG